ncbi:MBG domain-containing protein [Nocardioides sp.]|uniref:MBG domain-containing protein n=1 Tax=Nocardioides sp. TaxID=35761 RepID=UPI003512BFDD
MPPLLPAVLARGLLVLTVAAATLVGLRPDAASAAGSTPSVPALTLSVIANTAGAAGTAPADPAAGNAASARFPAIFSSDLAVDATGRIFVVSGNRLVRLDPAVGGGYTVVRIAGTGASTTSAPATGAVAATASFGRLSGVTIDPAGRPVVNDLDLLRVYRIETDGTLTRIAGDGSFYLATQTAPLTSGIGFVFQLAFDSDGDLYLRTDSSRILRITDPGTPQAVMQLVVGGGTALPTSTPQPATSLNLSFDRFVVMPDDSLLVRESPGSLGSPRQGINARFVRIADGMGTVYATGASSGAITTTPAPVSMVNLSGLGSMVATSSGVIYATRFSSNDVVAVTPPATPDGEPMVQRVAGTGTASALVPGPALSSPITLPNPLALEPGTGALVLASVPTTGSGSSEVQTPQIVRLTPPPAPNPPSAPTAVAGYESASVTVVPAGSGNVADSFTVTASPGGATCTIDAADDPLSCTVTGLTAGTSYTFTATASAGTAVSTASPASNAVVPLARTAVTITADDATKVYGEVDPAFTYRVSGLEPGDALTTTPTCTRAAGEGVGSRAITCADAAAAEKYAISYVAGSLSITARPITVTPTGQSRVFRDALPSTYPFTVTSGSLVGQDEVTGTCGVQGTPSAVGSYPITCTLSAGSNYTLTVGAADLVITKKPGAVVPNDVSITFGESAPTFTYSVTGIADDDVLDTAPMCGVGQEATDAGTYTISCAGGADSRFELDQTATATLTVAPAPATVTPTDASRVYGSPDPEFTATVSSTVGTPVFTEQPVCAPQDPSASAGSYVLVCTGGSAGPNYALSYVEGSFEITPAPLTLRADDKSRVTGAPNPTLTYRVEGLVEGDDAAEVIEGEPALTTVATPASPAGEYPIEFTADLVAGVQASPDYEVQYVSGTLTVTEADTDGDGLSDAREEQLGTDPRRRDTDRDGLSDGVEVRGIMISARVYTGTGADEAGRVIGLVRTNPLRKDTDRDGLSDRREVRGTNVKQVVQAKGGRYTIGLRVTNPVKADTDGDGLSDKQEVTGSANKKFDRARTDPNRADTDKSGMKDGTEIERGFNPVTL